MASRASRPCPGPRVYRLAFHVPDAAARVYIGETDDLRRRAQNYRTPGATQRTSLRMNQELVGRIDSGRPRLLLVAGKDWWWEVRDLLGLRDLRPGSLPVIASGQIRGVMVVATYHPGAHIRGLTRDAFAAAVASSVAGFGETGESA